MHISITGKRSFTHLLAIVLGLTSIALGRALSQGSQWINLSLLGGMVLAYLGVLFFLNRKIILIIFLLVIVNLDFIRLLSTPFHVTLDILFTLTIILLAFPLILTGKIAWRRTAIQKAFLIYLAVTLICVFLSVDLLVSFKRWMRYASYYMLLSLVMDTVSDRATLGKFSKIMLYSAIAPCLIGFFGAVTQHPSLIGENLRFLYGIEMVRIKSTLSHANTFGLFLSLIITMVVGFLLRRRERPDNISNFGLILLLFLMAPMLYFTYSRIGWIVTTFSFLLLLLFYKRWRLLTIFPWLTGLFLWRVPGMITRWSDIIDPAQPDSLDFRQNLYAFSLNKFINKPIFGSGPGTFLEYVAYQKGYSQHHLWIGSLVEVGIIGTIALAILLLVVLAQLAKKARRRPSPLKFIALAIYSVLLLVSVASDPFSTPSVVIYLWALIGLVEAEDRILLQETERT
jgi:O-antigen ligase